ncbi:MAG TPA: carboxypeptidase-like regulatory domain-containing protein [Gemmatimonadales bacterium]|jgi:hypothetical protein
MSRLTILILALAIAVPAIARGQAAPRQVSGRVFDDTTGCPLRGVQIQASNSTMHVLTDANGRYRMANPPATSFSLMAAFRGYQSRQSDTMTVTDDSARVDFSLLRAGGDSSRVAYPRRACQLEPSGR